MISVNGFDFEIINIDKTSNSAGNIDKVWLRNIKTGEVYIAKGSSFLGLEPISEYMAYLVGTVLGFNPVETILLPRESLSGIKLKSFSTCKYISISKKVQQNSFNVTTIVQEKKKLKAFNNAPLCNKDVMEHVMQKQWIDRMLLFDAIILNKDRYYRNVHVLKNELTGEYAECPLIDNGDSLLATGPPNAIFANMYDKSCTIAKTHSKQLDYITTVDLSSLTISAEVTKAITAVRPITSKLGLRGLQVEKLLTVRIAKIYRRFGAK